MAHKKFWLGMLVMVLVFGMTVISCDNDTTGGGGNGGGGTNIIDTMGLTSGRPAGADWDPLITAAGGNPVGFIPGDSPGSVELLVWTGRTRAQFDAIVAFVDDIPYLPVTLDGTPTYENGVYTAYFNGFPLVTFNPARISGPRPDLELPAGYYIPARTVFVILG